LYLRYAYLSKLTKYFLQKLLIDKINLNRNQRIIKKFKSIIKGWWWRRIRLIKIITIFIENLRKRKRKLTINKKYCKTIVVAVIIIHKIIIAE